MRKRTGDRLPEWAPEKAGQEFASRVMRGVTNKDGGGEDPNAEGLKVAPAVRRFKRVKRDAGYYVDGILGGNRTTLAQAITLVESNLEKDSGISREILTALLPKAGQSMRIGITGVPGAGKSTFIDSFGEYLCSDRGKKVAVLAVDPSSSVSGGSILGDKTRMEKLCRHPNAFIRPSPTGGNLGGVTRKSRETIVLCEAFGFDVILVETVGVGQSETTVRSMVDFFLLLMISGAGDELQGIKKGVIEIADALLINKADGANLQNARLARQEYSRALRYLASATPGWQTEAFTCSALTKEGIPEFQELVNRFENEMKESRQFQYRRQQQRIEWMFSMTEQHLVDRFYQNAEVRALIDPVKSDVAAGKMSTSAGAEKLLETFYRNYRG